MPKKPLAAKKSTRKRHVVLPSHDHSAARTRHLLALIAVDLFAFSLVATTLDPRAAALSGTLTQVVMLIIGYYFGKA